MRNVHVLALALVTALLFTVSCTDVNIGSKAHDGYTIEGSVSNANPNIKVFLDKITTNQQVDVIDTGEIDANGKFTMQGKLNGESLTRLRIGTGRNAVMLILNDGENVAITMDARNPSSYEITGSKNSMALRDLVQRIQTTAPEPRNEFLKAYADTVSNIYLAYMAINNIPIESDYEVYQKFSKRLSQAMPNNPMSQEFATRVAKMAGVMNTQVGKIAPEISLSTPDGKDLALSDLKGKIVLVDFWASWCRPCRKENPNVVKAYEKYKSKGFTVYSVSLDKQKERWLKAIKDDGLIWNSHVSDLAGWQSSAAALYSVKSIPQTFLLDKEGKIVAKNLRGKALEDKLEELL